MRFVTLHNLHDILYTYSVYSLQATGSAVMGLSNAPMEISLV